MLLSYTIILFIIFIDVIGLLDSDFKKMKI